MLMCGQMVVATLADIKKQTRRVNGLEELNRYPGRLTGEGAMGPLGYRGLCPSDYYVRNKEAYRKNPGTFHWFVGEQDGEINPIPVQCPYGAAGDRLWVREAHRLVDCTCPETCRRPGMVWYEADSSGYENAALNRLCPSIHMPRWASRITLEIVRIRVERVQDITDADALAEGIERGDEWNNAPAGIWLKNSVHVDRFARLWDSINKARSHGWEKNDWVWVVEFKRVPQPTKEAA